MKSKNKSLAFIITLSLVLTTLGLANPSIVKAATTITDCAGLAAISGDLDGDYVLGNDIDCSGVADWTALGTFTGKLDGAGFEIQHLTIQGYDNSNAFFTQLDGAKLYNLSFTDADVQTNFIGAIVAANAINNTKIVNVHIQGQLISGAALSLTGSLVGVLNNSDVYYSSANVNISGYEALGGLVGISENGSTIQYSYSEGLMAGIDDDPGAGVNIVGQPSKAGGLVGDNNDSIITNSYSTMDIQAHEAIVGGLVGLNEGEAIVQKSFSSGSVASNSVVSIGGLVGSQIEAASTEDSYWDTENSTQVTSAAGTGKTSAQMHDVATFVGWDFDDTWDILPGNPPHLFAYDDTPGILTEISQIPSRATYGDIAYIFDDTLVGLHDYIVTPCGGISEPLVGENVDGNMEMQLQQAEIGDTYTCEVYTRNLTEIESNHLTIGPFTVISGNRSGSITKKNLDNLPIPNQQTPALTPEQQIATPTLGLASLLTRNLYFGLRGSDVKTLQQYLNTHGFPLAQSGPGSPGNETELFGPLTRAAVIRYQKAHSISPSVGYVGPITRALINK